MALAVVGFGEPQALPLGHPARDRGPRVHELTLGGIDCCFYGLRQYAIGADHLRVGRGRASAVMATRRLQAHPLSQGARYVTERKISRAVLDASSCRAL